MGGGAPNAPAGVVIDAEIGKDKPVSGGNDQPTGDMRIAGPNLGRHMSRRFADQFEITQCRIVDEAVVDEFVLRELRRIGAGLLRKAQHVADVEPPFAADTQHARLLFL